MKYSPLLPQAALVFAVVYACTDSTAPANSHASLTPKTPTPAFLGDPPPPPVDAAIIISVESDLLIGTFTGVYFANASILESVAAAREFGDEVLANTGTAWLRLDNTQTLGSSASANARFQIANGNLSGRGTLVIEDALGAPHTIRIIEVTNFIANPDCAFAGDPCATITFDATVDDSPEIHHGTAQAFDREVCDYVFVPDASEEGGGHYEYFCPFGGGSEG